METALYGILRMFLFQEQHFVADVLSMIKTAQQTTLLLLLTMMEYLSNHFPTHLL